MVGDFVVDLLREFEAIFKQGLGELFDANNQRSKSRVRVTLSIL
jgi:hypothetical protein